MRYSLVNKKYGKRKKKNGQESEVNELAIVMQINEGEIDFMADYKELLMGTKGPSSKKEDGRLQGSQLNGSIRRNVLGRLDINCMQRENLQRTFLGGLYLVGHATRANL